MSNKSLFQKKAEKIAFNENHRKTIRFNMGKYYAAVNAGKARYNNLEATRTRTANIKRHTLENLAQYLQEFEETFTRNGGEVLWARTADDAVQFISRILQEHNVKSVVKSKSMTTEEIELNHELEKIGIESVETDLGEYIVQLAGEKPYHIVTPAMHKSKRDVAELFHNHFNFPLDSTAEEMTALAREKLREKYLAAGAGITGANFVIANKGAICVTENEGNAIMSTAFPPIHIAIAGIEKVIPSMQDLAVFWAHLAQHGTGQAISSYSSMFSAAKKEGESDGPKKMYVILLDNGRTNLYKNKTFNVALSCIRCGACLNACPIYKNIGGYTYNTTYQGPIGTVITPHLKNFADYVHLSSACSLCGACSSVCPQRIPLHELILENRKLAVQEKLSPEIERIGMKGFEFITAKGSRMDSVNGTVKNTAIALFAKNAWGKKRAMPRFATLSFRKLYKKNT
ncbi:MAG: iron-sulfur cluster-binding protein [Bacteroidales bacterium]|jgi:L-lactate dehydrogenase complex protein LldF|nr:iron-sulfur cluster-binding protein [Bacteroidales bacterium]